MMRSLLLAAAGITMSAAVAQAKDTAYGEYLASECRSCHVFSGDAKGTTPSLEGWDGEGIKDALVAYQKGEREDGSEAMASVAKGLDAEQIEALAAYFDKLSSGK